MSETRCETQGGAMRERPILFSGPMVRAILEGRKTQTRRVMKSQPYTLRTEGFGYPTKRGGFVSLHSEHCLAECPYGKPGDRLWVREAFKTVWEIDTGFAGLKYKADGFCEDLENWGEQLPFIPATEKWRPSIHMPRWASRLTLEITDVRVQRLQEITPKDCIAEGIEPVVQMGAYQTFVNYAPGLPAHLLPRDSFRTLWNSINGADSWDANPWVWAVSFKVLQEGQ